MSKAPPATDAEPEEIVRAMARQRDLVPPRSFSRSEFRQLARHSIRSGIRNFYRNVFPEAGDVEFLDEKVDGIVRKTPDTQDAKD